MATILIASCQLFLLQAVQQALMALGHQVVAAASPQEAISVLGTLTLDAAVLSTDLGVPEVARLADLLKEQNVPLLFLVSPEERWLPGTLTFHPRSNEVLVRPCPGPEVARHLSQLLQERGKEELLTVGPASFYPASQQLKGPYGSIGLTGTEAAILEHLARHRGRIVSIRELLQQVWGYPEDAGSPDVVRTHIRNLRHKLRQVAGDNLIIQTVAGKGYRIS